MLTPQLLEKMLLEMEARLNRAMEDKFIKLNEQIEALMTARPQETMIEMMPQRNFSPQRAMPSTEKKIEE